MKEERKEKYDTQIISIRNTTSKLDPEIYKRDTASKSRGAYRRNARLD